MLYGGSGGGYLALEVVYRFGDSVRRVFVEAAVMPGLTGAMAVEPDRFWSELAEADPALQGRLLDGLESWAEQRNAVVMALSRQHYFHTADELPAARAELIEALARGDIGALQRARDTYQVDAVENLMASTEAIPIRVRMFELHQPALDRVALDGEAVYPTLEMSARMARPLLELAAAGRLQEQSFDILELGECQAEVFVLAARWDQAVDYRTQIELARVVPSATLFLADDNHMFTKLKAEGLFSEIVQTYLLHGPDHPETDAVLERMDELRWDGIASPPPERYWGEPSGQQVDAFSKHVREHFDDIHDVSMAFHLDDPSIGGLIGLRTVWFDGHMVMGEVVVNETGVEAEGRALLEAIRRWTVPDLEGPVDISNGFRIKLVGSDDPAFPVTAIVTGTVRDRDGAPIHRATVTFVGPGDPPAARTNVQGVYVRTLIPQGTWELRCAAEGFHERVVAGVELAARQHVRVDFVLEPVD
jgi:pimeloyl-ACP methyl ester carboxylesterase